MAGVTLIVAIIFCILVLSLRPGPAFGAFIAAKMLYPSYLVVQIGTIDISLGRIVVAALLLRCILNSGLMSKFKWSMLDKWVTAGMAVSIIVPSFSFDMPLMRALENQSGQLMDTYFAYFAARLCITDLRSLIDVGKCVAVILLPLAVLGLIETFTGWQPFVKLYQFRTWEAIGTGTTAARFGLARASGVAGNPIMFGIVFGMFIPLIYSLRHDKENWGKCAYWLFGSAIIGSLTSLSSSAWVMTICVLACLYLENHKKLIKPIFIIALVGCVLVAIISNRAIHHVIFSYLNPIGGSSWHRIKLIDLSIKYFDQWWLAGYGGRDPGWGPELGRSFTDITNHYIAMCNQYGLAGLITFVGMLGCSITRLISVYKSSRDRVLRSWTWSIGAVIASLIIVFSSYAFVGQAITFVYCILGISGSLPITNYAKQTCDVNRRVAQKNYALIT